MSSLRRTVFAFSPEALAVGIQTPAKIFHRGIGPQELQALSGCVRKSDPSEFWHKIPMQDWVGEPVLFVVQDPTTGDELYTVERTITACYEKPVADVTPEELSGTITELAMQQVGCTLQQFFDANAHFRGFTMALIVRVK